MTKEYHFDIIRSPIITEKSTMLAETQNKIVVKVQKEAGKDEIKEAFEKIFGVKVLKINTIRTKGKIKRFRGVIGKRPDFKKAIITLEKGVSLDILSGV